MNAADRRRLTPMLVVVAGVLGVLLVALWAGTGRGAHWNDDASAPPLPPVGTAPPAPKLAALDAYALVWQRPLFSPNRMPMDTVTGGASGDLQLTGVILLPQLKLAIVHDKASGRDYRLLLGQPAADAPLLLDLQPRSAELEVSGSRLRLQLVPGPAPDAGNPPAPNAPGRGSPSADAGRADRGISAMVSRRAGQDTGSEVLQSAGQRARLLAQHVEASDQD